MTKSLRVGALAAAIAVAAPLAASAPAAAFTLSSPSLEAPVAGANVDKVWWDRWGRWHPGPRYWGGGYWGPGYWGPGYGPGYWRPHRHCWVNPWGHWRCGW